MISTNKTLPSDLLRLIENKKCIFFLGAGMSATSGLPYGTNLCEKLLAERRILNCIPTGMDLEKLSLKDIAHYCKENGSESTFNEKLANLLSSIPYEISVEYRLLAFLCKKITPPVIVTTNYDLILEHTLNLYGVKYSRIYTDDCITTRNSGNTVIVKLAGDIHNIEKMRTTSKDLSGIANGNAFRSLNNRLESGNEIMIFIGYSLSDEEIKQKLSDSPKYYYVGDSKLKPSFLNIEVISNTAQDFFCELINKLNIKINIGHIKFDDNNFGGIETYLSHINMISSLQNEQSVEGPQFNNIYKNLYSVFNENERKLCKYGFPFIKGASSIIAHQLMSRDDVDIIHAHDFISAYYAQMHNFPVVLTSHSLASKDSGGDVFSSKGEIKQLEKNYYPYINHIITLSEYHKNELPRYSNLHAKKLPVPFYHPVFTDSEKKEKIDRIQDDDFVLTYIGRNDPRKGLNIIIECFNILKERESAWTNKLKLLLITSGISSNNNYIRIENRSTPSSSIINFYKESKIHSHYVDDIFAVSYEWRDQNFTKESFEKHFSQIANTLRRSNLIIIPSYYEPFGYVALEAMSCGIPILANNTGGLHEILESFGNLCDLYKNDGKSKAETLASEIIKMISLKGDRISVQDKYVKKAIEGKNWIISNYTQKHNMDAVNSIHKMYIDSLLNANSEIRFQNINPQEEEQTKNCVEKAFYYYFGQVNDAITIIKRASFFYKDLLYLLNKANHSKNPPERFQENYGLIWVIAGQIKKRKSSVPEISTMSVRTLSETITEILRARATIIYSIFEKVIAWDTFCQMPYEDILKKYDMVSVDELTKVPNIEEENNNFVKFEISDKVTKMQKRVLENILANMVYIKSQTFTMGAIDDDNSLPIEKPAKKVVISAYYISKYLTTQYEWMTFNNENSEFSRKNGIYNVYPHYPVEQISWKECKDFIEKLNSLLINSDYIFDFPTEAQWECAAKCGIHNSAIYSGDDDIDSVAWYGGNTEEKQPVGRKKPNIWGLYDMCGNLFEHCKDVFSDKYYDSIMEGATDPCCTYGPKLKDHTLRGGCYNKPAQCCRITNRYDRVDEDCKDGRIGLRLVLRKKR